MLNLSRRVTWRGGDMEGNSAPTSLLLPRCLAGLGVGGSRHGVAVVLYSLLFQVCFRSAMHSVQGGDQLLAIAA